MSEIAPMEWIRGIPLGRGSFSTVNLAIPTRRDSYAPPLMVVKSSDVSTSDSLINEREVLRRLGNRCPQITRCFGDDTSFENGCRLYNLFFEYASSGSLYDHLRRSPGMRLSEFEVKRHANSILRGLCFIHESGFVHGDIKLQNVLVFDDGKVKISDFGLARERQRGKTGGFELRGTPLYMAPELVAGGEGDAPADVWALGCAVVEMISGMPAWKCEPGCGVPGLLCKIGAGKQSPEIPEGLSDQGKDFVSKCFVKDPRERWTARMLLDHPFVSGFCVQDSADMKDYDSPKGPFDFPDSTPTAQASDAFSSPEPFEWGEECWEEEDDDASVAERIAILVGNPKQVPDWSDSESEGWITVR